MYDKDHKKELTDEEVLAAVVESAHARPSSAKSKSGIVVKGIHDVAVRFSKCCSPVPGDEIVGFVTRGRGISIHRTDCVNIMHMPELERVRLIVPRGMNTRVSKQGLATMSTSFEVRSREELNRIIEKILSIESVVDIERTTG